MRPLVKVCGLTRQEDVLACDALGVDYLGFIFAKKSPRFVPPAFVASLGPTRALKVGVFVEGDSREIAGIMDQAGLDLAQLHGGQAPDFCREIGPSRVIKVLWPMRHADAAGLEAEMRAFAPVCAFMLLDAGTSGGGHGQRLDESLLAGLRPPRPWFLAGGLTPDTVAQAAALGPYALDINSGVESSPGVKERALVQAALENVEAS